MELISQGRLGARFLSLQSDQRLAELTAEGRGAAFDALVRRHRERLVRACSRILPDSQAEDAVQQGLLNAQQALLRNGPPERFEPWLHRIAINEALKEIQRTPQNLPLHEESVDGVEQPLDQLERRERLGIALAAMARLPERQRRALVMRELEGRSHGEIAQALGLTSGAARQLIHRARGAMRSAVTALTPYGLLARLAGGAGTEQTAEMVAGGAAGTLAGKALITAALAGGIAGGVALAPEDREPAARAADERAVDARPVIGGEPPQSGPLRDSVGIGPDGGEGRASPGPGSDDRDEDDDHSGRSGSGGGSDSSGSSSSGSGSSGSGSGGSVTSGSGSSGSGSSGSGSSGSGSSGSGSSGSGSGDSGSGGGESDSFDSGSPEIQDPD